MSASRNKSVRIPHALADAAKLRAKALGYENDNAYVLSLMRYDMVVQGPHGLTTKITKLSREELDKFDAHLLELTKKGVGERGVYLKHMLEGMGELGVLLKKALEL